MEIIINNIDKVSFNQYNHYHWTKKKAFKDKLRVQALSSTKLKLKGGYTLKFEFTFKGRRLDTINVVHYCKVLEDFLFIQDKENRDICISVNKGNENKCKIILKKLQ